MKILRILPLLLCLPFLSLRAQQEQYIVHSSGLVLGYSASDSRAVILSSTDKAVRPLTITSNTDGSSYISFTEGASTLYLQLGTANTWSTYFQAGNGTARARYTIEKSGNYVLLKNQQTGKYLGTDATTSGSSCFSDKSGTDAKHRWRLSDTPNPAPIVDTYKYIIDIDAQRQICEGWGVSLCWWAGQCGKWSQTKMDELLKWMVSPTGLNWNIFRYNIGGGDDPQHKNCTAHHMDGGKGHRAEMEGFQDERGGEYHWDRDAAQRRIMLRIKELRPDAVFEAFSNSCPWWMTVSGCVSGSKDGNSDNLRKDYYEDFAHYLVDVCKHYKDEYGIEFKTLEPFNEANTNYWKQNGGQEGCHFSPQSQVAFLKVLIPILKESGLSTQISASDETNVGGALGELNEYIKTPSVLSNVPQWNTHTYGANTRERSQMGSLARSKGMTMWMSETGSGGSGIGGNLAMTKRLFDDVRYIAPDAWVDWQYMEEANDQWCMVQGKFDGTSHKRVKNYYVRQQVTRFIKQGYTFVTSLNENCLAALGGDTLVVCLLNEGDKAIHDITLPMARINGDIKAYRTTQDESCRALTATTMSKVMEQTSDSTFTITLPTQSLTTLLIPVQPQAEPTYSYKDDATLWQPTALTNRQPAYNTGDTFLIVPQSNHTMAVSDAGSSIVLAPADLDDPAQHWTIEDANGYVRLRSGSGRYATWQTSSYALRSQKNTSSFQLYTIKDVDGLHVRFLQKGSDKVWDLNNQSLSAGTTIGSYSYGNSATADTRHWLLVRIATPSGQTAIHDIQADHPAAGASRPTPVYDLQGRPVLHPLPGHLYIQGGKVFRK